MNQHWINFTARKRALAGLFVPLVFVACGGPSDAMPDQGTVMAPVMASGEVPAAMASKANQAVPEDPGVAGGDIQARAESRTRYSVVNLGSDADTAALLNERGQAAFGSFGIDGASNGFFDGDHLHDVGSLGGGFTSIRALNKHGVVVGVSNDSARPFSTPWAVSWTAADGMRALAGRPGASAFDINDRGQIVGSMPVPGTSSRAMRWDPLGSVTFLGPLSLSEARAINNHGQAAGVAVVASGSMHAATWNSFGALTDLLTRGSGMHVNEAGEVAGTSSTGTTEMGFFWSAESGLVAIHAEPGRSRKVAALNNHGQVAGDTTIADRNAAYLWSRRRGVVLLPLGSGVQSDVFDLNDRTEMVGSVERPASEGGGMRAVLWPGLAAPIDLNARLYRPPAGLVLYAGAAINEDGLILAHSNAGLVLLRPGKRGTAAPALGPVSGMPDAIEVGQQAQLSVGFVDNAPGQTHKANATWSDKCPSPSPQVQESRGTGQVRLQHRFCAPGFFSVKVLVTDSAGRSTEVQREFTVHAAALATISGKGTLVRGPGAAGTGNKGLPLHFVLWAPLGNKPAGSPFVGLYGPFHFRSDPVMTAALAGPLARIEGTGRFNGHAGYRFLIEASDGKPANADRLRVRITHADANSGAQVVDYDNGAPVTAMAAAPRVAAHDATTVVSGGLTLRH